VDPGAQRRGLGTRLLEAARKRAGEAGRSGLLVRANREARGFFEDRGLEPLPVRDESRDYPYRFWLPVASAEVHRR
jgi:GNAT superfamily N-acetyltransferase